MDTATELGRNRVSKHQSQPEHGDEQADAGRDCRTRIAKPNSQARTGTKKYSFFLFSRPGEELATLPGCSVLLLYVMNIHPSMHPSIHTYIHTYNIHAVEMVPNQVMG